MKKGLDVEINTAGGQRPGRSGGIRKAQFGVSFQDSMAPGVAGDHALPNTAVAALIQHNTSGIISRKGRGWIVPKAWKERNMPLGMDLSKKL